MAKLDITETITMALASFWTNKLRTLLTLLGIIIGVLTIIAVVSIIQGLNEYVYTKMSFFGANDFSVSKFSLIGTSLEDFKEQLKRKNLTLEDMELLERHCTACELIGASINTSKTVKAGNESLKNVEIAGVTHVDHLIGSVQELKSGRHFLKDDIDHSRWVCIIGSDIHENLFPYIDPLGRWVKIGAHNFQVIGVAAEKGKLLGMSQDNFVRIPISTFHKIYGSRQSININVHTNSQEQMLTAQEQVRTILRSRRHVPFDQPDDFSFRTSDTFIQFYKSATTSIYFAMIAISSIALLVGGIVVMNIMLVAVTERTKEIGIRMAVGARRKDILFQFLIESAVLSASGGIIGIVLGYLLARIVTSVSSMPSTLDPGSIAAAIIVSASVGIFFGLYPASKAAKLNPIQALRTEL